MHRQNKVSAGLCPYENGVRNLESKCSNKQQRRNTALTLNMALWIYFVRERMIVVRDNNRTPNKTTYDMCNLQCNS